MSAGSQNLPVDRVVPSKACIFYENIRTPSWRFVPDETNSVSEATPRETRELAAEHLLRLPINENHLSRSKNPSQIPEPPFDIQKLPASSRVQRSINHRKTRSSDPLAKLHENDRAPPPLPPSRCRRRRVFQQHILLKQHEARAQRRKSAWGSVCSPRRESCRWYRTILIHSPLPPLQPFNPLRRPESQRVPLSVSPFFQRASRVDEDGAARRRCACDLAPGPLSAPVTDQYPTRPPTLRGSGELRQPGRG